MAQRVTNASEVVPAETQLDGRSLRLSKRDVKLDGRQLGLLEDGTHLLHDAAAMRTWMAEHGYLLIRSLVPKDQTDSARRVVLAHLRDTGQLDPVAQLEDGLLKEGTLGSYLGGQKQITHQPGFLAMAESPALYELFTHFFGEPAMTFDYKWLRAVGSSDGTAPHCDVVFMGRGSVSKLFTCWLPLGDIALNEGPLAVLEGSHCLESYGKVRATYGKADVDRDCIDSNLSYDPLEITSRYGGQWKTTAFRAGDALIFGMHTLHAAIRNETRKVRISADLRFQPRSEPIDERWKGNDPIANYVWATMDPAKRVPVDESRREWGV